MSQYDDLLNAPDTAAPDVAQSDNEYLNMLDESERQQKQAVAGQLSTAVKVNPDQYSTQRRVASYLGYPVAAVEANPQLKEQAQVQQVQQDTATRPVLQRKYTDADFAKLAHDDSGSLAALADFFVASAKYITSSPDKPQDKTLMGDIAAGVRRADAGAAGLFRAASELLAVPLDFMEADTPEQAAGWRGSVGGNPLRRLAEGFGMIGAYDERRAKELSPDSGNLVTDSISSGVQSLTQNTLLLPLALLPGGEPAVLYGMAGTTGGQSYEKAREAGVGQWTALGYGASDAVIEYATEKIPLGKLIGDLKANSSITKMLAHQIATEIPGEQVATIFQDLNEWAVLHPEQTFGDYLRERPSAAAQTLIATLIGVGGNVAVTHTLARVAQQADGSARAEDAATAFGDLTKLVEATKLAERSPEEMRSLLHELSGEANVRIDAATLMEAFNQSQLDIGAVLPSIDAQDLRRQAAAGGEVSAPLAEVATAIRGTPLEQSLPEHIRFGSNEMSAAEAKLVQGELKEKFAREMEQAVAQAQDAEAFRQSAENVRATLQKQLDEAGRYRSQVNELMSQWAGAFYATMAQRTGMTPEEMYARYPLRVLSQSAQHGNVLNEARTGQLNDIEGYHYSKAERSTISTGAFGTGLEGSNRDAYLNAKDQRLRKRAYFYVDKGTGINPEAGVGGVGHRVNLSNVYDADADPLRLKTGRDQLGFESAVLDSGFGGYLSRLEGTQSGQVIMLGDQTFTPEKLGALGKTQGRVVPQPAQRQARGRDQVVDRLRANKSLPMGSPSLASWEKMLAAVMPHEHAAMKAAGVFEGEGNFYKDELIRRFEERTPAEKYEQAVRPNLAPSKTTGESATRKDFAPKKIGDILSKSNWAILTAENPMGQQASAEENKAAMAKLRADLKAIGAEFMPAVGKYGQIENSLVVTGITEEQAVELGRKYQQDSVLTPRGLVYPRDNSVTPTTGSVEVFDKAPEDFYTTIPSTGAKFAVGLDWAAANEDTPSLPATLDIDGKQRSTTNSNGQPITATEEGVRNFWKWFGDSKVVDAEGRPLVVYHGRGEDFAEFKTEGGRGKTSGTGAFFTSNPAVAATYATGAERNITPVYLRVEAPVVVAAGGKNWSALGKSVKVSIPATERLSAAAQEIEDLAAELEDREPEKLKPEKTKAKNTTLSKLFPSEFQYGDETFSTDDLARWARKEGFEGVKFANVKDHGPSGQFASAEAETPSDNFVVFSPEQIKSAIGNSGAFDASNTSILAQQTPGFERWVGDATVVQMGEPHDYTPGEPVVVAALHGTTGDFDTFSREMADPESDLGAGFYASNTPEDVGTNYAGEGPDLTNKLTMAAERIASETDREYNDPDVMREARDALHVQHGGATMPVWVKFENPVVLGGNETMLSYEENYNEDTDEYEEPKGPLVDFVEALRDVASDYHDVDVEQTVAAIFEKAEGDSISASDLIKTVKTNEGTMYATDDEGRIVSTEIARRAFQEAGYDGFIDQTVSDKFQMSGTDADTVHFIAFEPNQIKSRIGNSGAFDSNNPSILAQTTRGTFNPQSLELVLGERADLSTWFHETGHFYLEVLADLATQPGAPQQIVDDFNAVAKWFGVDPAAWQQMSLDQKRRYHERFAESVEQYVMEGKAPSVELQPFFRRFRAWLLSVYHSVKTFIAAHSDAENMALNNEVRAVFDRMLATDEQIQQANDVAGLMPDPTADADAAERLQARSMRDLKWAVNARDKVIKKLTREAKAIEKEVRAQITTEVEHMPEMRAAAALDALKVTPEHQIVLDEWKAKRTAEETQVRDVLTSQLLAANPDAKGLAKGQLLAKNKRSIANQTEAKMIEWDRQNPKPARPNNTTDQDVATVADSFGFESVDAMLKAINDFGNKNNVIDALTERRMLEEHGDLVDERAIAEAANEAVHNEARARSLATELRTQREMLNPRQDTGRVASNGSKVTVNALVEAAKQFGNNVADNTVLKDLKAKVWQHTQAERRAARAWQEATAGGKTEEAVKAKQNQLLNNAAAKAVIDAKNEAAKAFEFFKRVVKGNDEKVVDKGRDPDIVNAARAVLAAYGVETPTTKAAAEYLETVSKNDPETYNTIRPMVEGALQMAQPLESLTVEQLRSLHEEIQSLWFLAKRSRQMEVDGDLMDIEDAAAQLHERMEKIGIPDKVPGEESALTDADKRKRWLQFAGALLRRVEQWSEKMDGKFGGPFLRLVFQPVKDAAEHYRSDRVAYRKAFTDLVDKVAPSFTHKLIEAPELGYTFGKGHNGIGHAELMHAILHTGNESNLRKLLLGRNWGELTPDGKLDTTRWSAFITRLAKEGVLTREHFDFAQGVWDLLEKTKPQAQKAHRDVFGRYFNEVTATPFVDPFGVERAGGYLPAQADPMIVNDADLRSLAEIENENMAFAFPATNKGFTKSRVEYNRPLKLDLRTIPQHLDKVLLFSHMEPAVRGVAKLLRNKGVSQALNRIDPSAYSGMLLPWLNRSARQMVETPIAGDGGASRLLSTLRSRAGAALMFANISNSVQQLTGFLSAGVKVDSGHMMRAAAQMVAHPKQMIEAVKAQSEFMRNRMEGEIAHMTDLVNDIVLNHSLYEKAQAWSLRNTYFLQQAIDNTTGPIIWTAAYNQGLADGLSEKEAVRFADGTIRQTQQATSPEDVSRIETGPAYARIFTQFAGYFNMLANTNATALQQIASEMGLKKGAGKALGVVFFGVLAPIWVAEAIAQAFKGGPDDKDHDGYLDDWLAAVFGMGTIKGLLAYVPFVGQLANAGINKFNSNPNDDRVSLSPTVGLLESSVGVPADVYNAIHGKLNAKKTIEDVASLVNVVTGLPTRALARPVGYLAGVEQDKIRPTSAADAVRGTATGAASPASRQH